jgi:hypothetical protein
VWKTFFVSLLVNEKRKRESSFYYKGKMTEGELETAATSFVRKLVYGINGLNRFEGIPFRPLPAARPPYPFLGK